MSKCITVVCEQGSHYGKREIKYGVGEDEEEPCSVGVEQDFIVNSQFLNQFISWLCPLKGPRSSDSLAAMST